MGKDGKDIKDKPKKSKSKRMKVAEEKPTPDADVGEPPKESDPQNSESVSARVKKDKQKKKKKPKVAKVDRDEDEAEDEVEAKPTEADMDSGDGAADGPPVDDTPKFLELGDKVRVSVEPFKGTTLVNIREYFSDKETDEWRPAKKGIALKHKQWIALKNAIDFVDKAFDAHNQ